MRDNMYKNGMKILDRKVIFITPYGRRGGRATIKNELKDKKEDDGADVDTLHLPRCHSISTSTSLCICGEIVAQYLHRCLCRCRMTKGGRRMRDRRKGRGEKKKESDYKM